VERRGVGEKVKREKTGGKKKKTPKGNRHIREVRGGGECAQKKKGLKATTQKS